MTTQDQRIKQLFARQKSDDEIAAAIGKSDSTVRKARRRLGLVRPRVLHLENLKHSTPKIDREYIAREFNGVESIPAIAEALGAHPDSVRRILRDEMHLIVGGHAPPVDPAKLAKADAMLDGTITYGEVAATVGLKRSTLEKKLPRRGLKTENYGAMRAARELEAVVGL